MELLGHPGGGNTDSDGVEQWVYAKSASEYNSGGMGVGTDIWNFAGPALTGFDLNARQHQSAYASKSTTFTVYFDSKGVVERYNFSSAVFN